ncbi:lipase secretion chaperone [Aquabacterium sp.]|uniref:lipase secretion chaperone n=1 Tax=Aquabacterium sp. TaxID=1872578 RepID=UPI003B7017C0
MHNGITITANRSGRLLWLSMSALVAALSVYGYRLFQADQPSDVAQQPAPSTGIIQALPAPSLKGTVPDGALHDGNGELIVSPDLLRRYDYWLTTFGEKPLAAIKADILKDLSKELNGAALARASKLLDAYLAFKTELARLTPVASGTTDAEALGHQLRAIREVRARHFSSVEIAQLFGQDDARDDDALARLRIAQDRNLSPTDKENKLRELTAQLPPDMQANRNEPVLHLTVSQAVAEARERGASAQEVQAIRTRLVGADAAQRLAKLDEEEAAWQARVQQYLNLRKANEAAAEAYKEANFRENEKLRLTAYQ